MSEADANGAENAENSSQEPVETNDQEGEFSVEELKTKYEEAQKKLSDVTRESISRKEKLRAFEEEQKKFAEEKLKEQNKYKELAELREKEVDSLRSRIREDKLHSKIESEAIRMGIKDSDCLKLLDRGIIAFDEETGDVHGVTEALESLRKNHSYLFKSTEKTPSTTRGNEGPKFNEKGGDLSMDEISKLPRDQRIALFRKREQARKKNRL